MKQVRDLLEKAFEQELDVAVDDGDGELQQCASLDEAMDIMMAVEGATLFIDGEGMFITPHEEDAIVDYHTGGWIEQNLG